MRTPTRPEGALLGLLVLLLAPGAMAPLDLLLDNANDFDIRQLSASVVLSLAANFADALTLDYEATGVEVHR